MTASMKSLIEKYNVPVPRYTSYPTVPNWNQYEIDQIEWKSHISRVSDSNRGVSLYIHLPYCKELCTYCGCNKLISKNHNVEKPYIELLKKEWDLYVKAANGYIYLKQLHLGGGTPSFFSPDNLKDLISYIYKDCELATDFEGSIEVHPNTTTEDHLTTLASLKFNRVSIGVQDINEHILKVINRKQTINQITKLTSWSRELGYESVNFDLIYGLPFQTEEHISDTLRYVDFIRPDRIAFYSYAHVPWKSRSQRLFDVSHVPKGLDKWKLFQLAKNQLADMDYQMIGFDHFCKTDDTLYKAFLEGSLHRNFMGYTTGGNTSTLGLGISSISATEDFFMQNEKNLKQYRTSIEQGLFPIAKSHKMSKLDRRIAALIKDLLCNHMCSIKDFQLSIHQDESLRMMMSDGLILYDGNSIQLLTKGVSFMRNVAAVLDANYKTVAKMYSQAI